MSLSRRLSLLACVAIAGWGAAFAADAPATGDVLRDRGLTRSGAAYVLADEAPVLAGMKALRATKAEADKEVRARTALDNQIAAKQKVVKDADKEWHTLEARLATITKPDIKNNVIVRMNRLVSDSKQADIALKDLDEQAGKLSVAAKTKFVDQMVALNVKAAAVTARYAALAADPAVKAAVAKANLAANPKAALGPSAEFAAAVEELKKWQGAVESEAIPLREDHGIFWADALLNGSPFRMGVDTGSSSVVLPWEVAAKVDLNPKESDPTVRMKLANGQIIEGKEMTLSAVRVGRFTVQNVRCVVLQQGLSDAPLLLGGSFLNHFIVKLDPSKRELQLTEIKAGGGGAAPAKVAPAGGK